MFIILECGILYFSICDHNGMNILAPSGMSTFEDVFILHSFNESQLFAQPDDLISIIFSTIPGC